MAQGEPWSPHKKLQQHSGTKRPEKSFTQTLEERLHFVCITRSFRLALAKARRASPLEGEGINDEFPQPLLTAGRSCFFSLHPDQQS